MQELHCNNLKRWLPLILSIRVYLWDDTILFVLYIFYVSTSCNLDKLMADWSIIFGGNNLWVGNDYDGIGCGDTTNDSNNKPKTKLNSIVY